MTSIIKVDQIQKPDGTAPTAADLGFAAGSVLNVQTFRSWSDVDNSSSTYVDVATFGTYTPVSSNSTILGSCGLFLRSYRNNAQDARYSAQILLNGSNTTGGYINNAGWYDYGASGIYAGETRKMDFHYSNTTGASLEIKLQTHVNGGISVRLNPDSNYSWVTIYEIAG